MKQKHNNLKRILHRCFEELKATKDIANIISPKAAYITFRAKIDIQIMNRNGYKETIRMKERLLKKHQIMLNYFEKEYKDYWNHYQCSEKSSIDCNPNLRNKIWICWWQGLENAPQIVQQCIKTIKQNAGKYEVIVITEKNCRDYVTFPNWIEEKVKKGIITKTQFSDMLRLNLLATYGGLWIDSTFYCTKSSLEQYMHLPLWTIKRPDYGHASVACGYFAGYSLGCSYENKWVYEVPRDFLFNYWKKQDRMIDYLLVDYAIVLAQKHITRIAELFNQIPPNNPNCDELFKVLGEPYNEEKWKRITQDTTIYKLTWKQTFPKTIDGKITFYGKLMEGTL